MPLNQIKPPARKTIKVSLLEHSYSIHVGAGLMANLGERCRKLALGSSCAILTDQNVGPLYAGAATRSLEAAGFTTTVITLPAGEKAKALRYAGECYDELAKRRLERKSFIVALGGGVVGDLAGFVAATYLRGIDFVQVPTTLLSQVDSSVGGKVGVNLKAGKNLVGAFYQPRLVICDLAALKTLPEREFRAGLAEVVKYGIIYDEAFFQKLEKNIPALQRRDLKLLLEIVARSCEIKAEVVGQDEKETGLRAILNFGHTIGHGLEAITSYGTYLHGEAISIGQVAAAELSVAQNGLKQNEAARLARLFETLGLPIRVRLTPGQKAALANAMKLDKKTSGGELRFVLARRIGAVEWGQPVSLDSVLRLGAINEL